MSMTVDTMLLLSRIFLGAMLAFILAAVLIFFLLDVRRAWRISKGRMVEPVRRKKTADAHVTQKLLQPKEEITRLLSRQGNIDSQYKGQDVTTVLDDTQNTVLLVSQEEQGSENDMMLDITFIHTEQII